MNILKNCIAHVILLPFYACALVLVIAISPVLIFIWAEKRIFGEWKISLGSSKTPPRPFPTKPIDLSVWKHFGTTKWERPKPTTEEKV